MARASICARAMGMAQDDDDRKDLTYRDIDYMVFDGSKSFTERIVALEDDAKDTLYIRFASSSSGEDSYAIRVIKDGWSSEKEDETYPMWLTANQLRQLADILEDVYE